MTKFRSIIIVGLCAAVFPALASAGNGVATGSCLWLYSPVSPAVGSSSPLAPSGNFENAECIDGLTQDECSAANVQWSAESCVDLELPFVWDGSCLVPESGLGEVCALVWTDPQADLTSQQRCESAPTEAVGGSGNTWYNDLVCGGAPVPTVPRATLALMVLVMLAGSLGILALRSSSV